MIRSIGREGFLLLLAAGLVLAVASPRCDAQSASRSTEPPAPVRPEAGFRVDPLSLYSPTYGPGLDAYLSLRHLPVPGSRIGLHLFPSAHRRLAFADGLVPLLPRGRMVFSGHFLLEQNRRHVYFGSGPFSQRANGIHFDRNGYEAEARLGLAAWGKRLLLQPLVRTERQTVLEVNQPESSAWAALQADPESSRNLPSFDRRESVQGAGIETFLDLRNRRVAPRGGLALEARWVRFSSSTSADVRFDRLQLGAHFAVPSVRDHVVAARALLIRTSDRGEAPIPFYLLPTLDQQMLPGYGHNRFHGSDLFVMNVEYRVPVARVMNLYRVDALVHAGAGSVYESFSDQFRLSVSFDRRLERTGGGVPLRPGAGLGVSVASLMNERVLLHWIVGWSPDRVTALPMRFEFTADLQRPRPTLR